MNPKNRASRWGAFFVLLTPAATPAALIQVGTGPDLSYFTLETPNLGLRHYAISYRYDPVAHPLGGADLLRVIEAEDPAVSFTLNDFGSPDQPNEFFDSLTFNGETEGNDFSPGGATFHHWVSGGGAGAGGLGIPDPEPVPEDGWSLGAGLSVNFRLVAPGSNDALVLAPSQEEPSVAPIPEPEGLVLLVLALPWVLGRRNRA